MANTTRKQPEPNTTIGDILREVMSEHGMTQAKLAEEMGYTTQSAVAERLRGDVRTSIVVKMLEMMGCELIVRDKVNQSKEWKVKELDATPVRDERPRRKKAV